MTKIKTIEVTLPLKSLEQKLKRMALALLVFAGLLILTKLYHSTDRFSWQMLLTAAGIWLACSIPYYILHALAEMLLLKKQEMNLPTMEQLQPQTFNKTYSSCGACNKHLNSFNITNKRCPRCLVPLEIESSDDVNPDQQAATNQV